MSRLRTAVVGVGYLGRFHAQKYAALDSAELIAVCDTSDEAARRVAEELDTRAIDDYRDLPEQVDAVSIVVPTQKHYEVARHFLDAGIHVLLEKPITSTLEQGRELVGLARERGVVFQIGHLERFNPAVVALADVLEQPKFIESHRIAPFNPRGADVNVVLDLMIHDIDIILDFVRSPVTEIRANGVPVLSRDTDVANARLQFENGCVANVTARPVSLKSERKMRIFQDDAYLTIDFQNKTLGVHRRGEGEMFPGIPEIDSQEMEFEQGDALLAEIRAFLDSIRQGTPPVVSGEDGLRALETAFTITDILGRT